MLIEQQSCPTKNDETGQQNTEEVKTQRQMLIATWILAGAGILQFIILVGTFFIMRDTARRQLRAYVCIESGLVTFPQPNMPEVLIEYKNTGQTPAYNTNAWINLWFGPHPLKERIPSASKNLIKGNEVLATGRKSTSAGSPKEPLPPHFLARLGTKEFTLYAYGEIRYRDVFRKERYTKYRFIHGGQEGVRPKKDANGNIVGYFLKPDMEGNDAD
jgi:hypothetical protein